MGMVITVSRQLGAGGERIACDVAETLGLRVIGQEIISEAMRAGIPQEIAMESEKGRRSWIQRALHWFDHVYGRPPLPGALMESTPAHISTDLLGGEDYYLSVMESIIFDFAQTHPVLLLGRAGQMIFRHHPNCLHVRVVAPLEKRIAAIEQRFSVNYEEARLKIADSDTARADYLKRHYDVDIDDARLYDLCINTGTFSKQAAVQLIVAAVTGTNDSLDVSRLKGEVAA